MTDKRLAVLPFLDSWTGTQLKLRVLLVPRDSFLEPFAKTDPSSPDYFPSAQLAFDVVVRPGLDTLPAPPDGTVVGGTTTFAPLDTAKQIFAEIKDQLAPVATQPARGPADVAAPRSVRKHLPASYRDAVGYAGDGSGLFSTDDTYSCLLKQMKRPVKYTPLPPVTTVSWGQLISGLLRNDKFAELAGLVRTLDVNLDTPALQGLLANGAFVYLLPKANASRCELFASRIPPLAGRRDLFSPVLFPASATPWSVGQHDAMFAEAEDYNDGWAKAVHCRQPQRASVVKEQTAGVEDDTRPAKELGIQIGWDDEQVTTWMDRQLDARKDPNGMGFGVRGYRVDARFSGGAGGGAEGQWTSLVRVTGSFGIGKFRRGNFDGESAVEVQPVQAIDDGATGASPSKDFWLPMYFTAWTGPALAAPDDDRQVISGRPHSLAPPDPAEMRLRGVPPTDLPLLYGSEYQFRVRLVDHTGHGPPIGSSPRNPGPSPVYTILFRRWIRPMTPVLVGNIPPLGNNDQEDRAPLALEFVRPGLQYPAVHCTGYYTRNRFPGGKDAVERLKELAQAGAEVEPSLPDPDVDWAEVTVQVGTVTQDTLAADGHYRDLYTTRRRFPANDMKAAARLELAWVDCLDIDNPDPGHAVGDVRVWWGSGEESGPLRLPKSRNVQLCVRSLCREDPRGEYFGADDVRRGPDVRITVRKNATSERGLILDTPDSEQFNAYYLQPDPLPRDDDARAASTAAGRPNERAPGPLERLAAEMGLRCEGSTLRAPPGRRVVFGCSAALRHVLGPDGASLTFSAGGVAQRWVVVVRLTLARDWTWDGLVRGSIFLQRTLAGTTTKVAQFGLTHNVNKDALVGSEIVRGSTDLVIVDAIDPLQMGGSFPGEIRARYAAGWAVVASSAGATAMDEPPAWDIRLPVTTPPKQRPLVVSAGVALSPYQASPRYSTTAPRTRMLWLWLADPPLDPGDRYFGRVLARGLDPLLQDGSYFWRQPGRPEALEPALAVDPEPLRRITTTHSDDRAGLDAMQPLVQAANSPSYWGLPLPAGVGPDAAELAGFYTYELRVGHWSESGGGGGSRWCTAQGRFGPPTRLAGVQHPPPELPCAARRTADGGVEATVPATNASPFCDMSTTIWVALYAQAAQADGAESVPGQPQMRNVLLLRAQAKLHTPPLPPGTGPSGDGSTVPRGRPAVPTPARPAAPGTSAPARPMPFPLPPPGAGFGSGFGFGSGQMYAVASFAGADVSRMLTRHGFTQAAHAAPLSVVAVELLRGGDYTEKADPIGKGLGTTRIQRTSVLVEVATNC